MITDSALQDLEAKVQAALRKRDNSALSVIGFGEITVALGHPSRDPIAVCKRTPPMTEEQFIAYQDLVHNYVEQLTQKGLNVIPTEVRSVKRDRDTIGYLVQPLLPSESLGHEILAGAVPDPEHPFLVAVAGAFHVINDRISIDAQVTNWSWDGSRLVLIDVSTPFVWNADSTLAWDMSPMSAMGPAPIRRVVVNEMIKVTARWKSPRQVAVDAIANLEREGLSQWIDAAIVALNAKLIGHEPITAAEAHAMYRADCRTFPLLKRMQQVERAWQTMVRRRPYDFFVLPSTFS